MSIWQACLWGLLGVALVEAHALWSALTTFPGTPQKPAWPWVDEDGQTVVLGYGAAMACRVAMGAGLDAVYAASQQIQGPLGAFTVGIAAPLLIKQLAIRDSNTLAPPVADVAESLNTSEKSKPTGAVPAGGGTDAR
jgi:hypothetical protein